MKENLEIGKGMGGIFHVGPKNLIPPKMERKEEGR